MKKIIQLNEASGDVKKALKSLSEFIVYGVSDISNAVSDALLGQDNDKANTEWLKMTNKLRLDMFDIETWIKKNVK